MHFLLLPAKQEQQARTTSSSALVIKQRVHIILKCNSIHSPTTSKIPLPSFHHHDDVPFRSPVSPHGCSAHFVSMSRPVKRPTRFQEWSLRTKLNSKLCPEQKSVIHIRDWVRDLLTIYFIARKSRKGLSHFIAFEFPVVVAWLFLLCLV
jgi:hypothetical protein